MVRESALFGVPSIEFIPSETYLQEMFLRGNGLPLVHVKTAPEIAEETRKFLEHHERKDTWDQIDKWDNPIDVAIKVFNEMSRE